MLETATNTGVTRTEKASVARVRALLERCAERESVSDSDWAYEEKGFSYREFADGWLAKTKVDEVWVLYRCTQAGYDPIARGPLAEIECDTREIVLFGPPCGLEHGAGSLSWESKERLRSWELKEGSLQATTIGGMFRLMLQPGGRGTLLYIRKDLGTDVLGTDDVETLKRTAEDLRQRHCGKPVRVWVAGAAVELHGVGLLGVVGQIELLRGTRLLLVRGDDDDEFDLYHVLHDGNCVLVGSYSGADLRRGDLGSILVPQLMPSAESVRTSPDPPASDGPAPPRSGGRAPPHLGRTPSRATNRASPGTTRPVLTEDDARRLETCLTPDKKKWTGNGITTLPYFFAAFDTLILRKKLKNLRLSCPGVRKLMKEEAGVTVPGVARTFARGLDSFMTITGLGTKRRRQWDIPCADFRRSGSPGMTRVSEMHEPAPELTTAPSAPASAPGAHAPRDESAAASTPAAASPTTPHARLTTTPPIGSAMSSPDVSTPTATHATPITPTVIPTPTTPTPSASASMPPVASAPTATPGSATHARSAAPQTPATAAASAVTRPSTSTPTATPAASAAPVRPTTPPPPATAAAAAVTQPFTSTPTAAHAGSVTSARPSAPSTPPATSAETSLVASTPTAAATSMSSPTPAPSADPGAMSAPTPAPSSISAATPPAPSTTSPTTAGDSSPSAPGEKTGPPLVVRETGPPIMKVRETGPPREEDYDWEEQRWHRTIRVDGQPTELELQYIKLPTGIRPSQFEGKEGGTTARGPPKE